MLKKNILCLGILLLVGQLVAKQNNARNSSFPYVAGDSFRALAHHLYDETTTALNPQKVRYKDIVFVKTDMLGNFFRDIHPHITQKYILISHNADHGAPAEFEHYLNDNKIIVWFAQNPTIKNHKKFIPIPIGIANQYVPHGDIENFNHVVSKRIRTKRYVLAINFLPTTALRKPAYDAIINKPFAVNLFNPQHRIYLESMSKSRFIVSPEGNGLDCHRHWEAMLVGSIPIIKTSMLDELLADLPVVIIDDWAQVTEEFLTQKYHEVMAHYEKYNWGKLYMPYWIRLIQHYRE